MADLTSALAEQAGEEQPRVEALGSLYGLYFGDGLANRDYVPVTESIVSSMAGALAAQGPVIRGQGEDYASIMALGIGGFDFTTAAHNAIIGLRSGFGSEQNLNILLGTGDGMGQIISDGLTNFFSKPGWGQTLFDLMMAEMLAGASDSLTGAG